MKYVYASRTGNVEALIGKLGIDAMRIDDGSEDYGDAYCQAGDKISETYDVPCLYKVENDGTDEDVAAIKAACNI